MRRGDADRCDQEVASLNRAPIRLGNPGFSPGTQDFPPMTVMNQEVNYDHIAD